MSLSITLSIEDTSKLVDTAYLLDHLFSTLKTTDTLDISVDSNISYVYTKEQITELSSWYKNIVQILRYNNYDLDLSSDEEYLESLTA